MVGRRDLDFATVRGARRSGLQGEASIAATRRAALRGSEQRMSSPPTRAVPLSPQHELVVPPFSSCALRYADLLSPFSSIRSRSRSLSYRQTSEDRSSRNSPTRPVAPDCNSNETLFSCKTPEIINGTSRELLACVIVCICHREVQFECFCWIILEDLAHPDSHSCTSSNGFSNSKRSPVRKSR